MPLALDWCTDAVAGVRIAAIGEIGRVLALAEAALMSPTSLPKPSLTVSPILPYSPWAVLNWWLPNCYKQASNNGFNPLA